MFVCCCSNLIMFYDWRECVMSVLGTTKNIPIAIVLTPGNKVVLHCIRRKMKETLTLWFFIASDKVHNSELKSKYSWCTLKSTLKSLLWQLQKHTHTNTHTQFQTHTHKHTHTNTHTHTHSHSHTHSVWCALFDSENAGADVCAAD